MFSASKSSSNSPQFQSSRLAWLCSLTAFSTLLIAPSAIAQTILPDPALDLRFQTSGPRRCANIGDWYTTFGRGADGAANANGLCGTFFGGPADTVGAPGFHSFFISITEADLAGGPVAITIIDPGSDNPGFDEVFGATDPTRFTLFDPNGAVIQVQSFNNPADPGTIVTTPGSTFTFPLINSPGNYQIRSETGSYYLNGRPAPINDTNAPFGTNNDDNSFRIQVPIDNLLIGQQIGSFQQDSGGNIDLDLFFLVGPSVPINRTLFLRNFDLDNNGDILYTSPTGATPGPTTRSQDSGWNPLNDINTGGDTIPLNPDGITDAGLWTFSINNFTSNNQTIVEANDQTGELPIFEQQPIRAGNFTITRDTTLTTTIGNEVCHPFTVTNNFFTTDIVNLVTTGTDPNVIAQLRDANGNPLTTDADGNGQVDTGILQPGQSVQFFLCVTPQAGAPGVDVTTITGTSFMDAQIRRQAVADGVPGATLDPEPQSVEKRTLIPAPSIGLAKTNSALRPVGGGLFDVDLTFVVRNTGNTILNNVQIEEDLQEVFVDNPQVGGVASDGATSIDAVSLTEPITFIGGGTAPTFNAAYDGNGDINLFDPGSSFNPGDQATITITVRLNLAPDNTVDIDNSAVATGEPPGGGIVDDISQSGSDVDPDNDGDPTNNNEPNRIRIPSIGVAKTVSTPTQIGSTTYQFDYTILVENTGTIELTDVQLTENLQTALIDNAFNRADSFTVTNVALNFPGGPPTEPPTLNPAYNGTSVTTLFDNTVPPNRFDPGQTAQVVITVQADLGAVTGTPSVDGLNDGILEAQNTATASGNPPTGGAVTDVSQDGTDVDPDNDGNPNNNSDPTTLLINSGPNLNLVKRITNVFRGGVPIAVPGITQFNDQDGFLEDNALNTALGGGNALAGVFELPAGFSLQPNDELEYTVYFWNNSGSIIRQLEICDELQPPSVLNTAADFELSAVRVPPSPPVFFNSGPIIEGRSPGAPLDQSCISVPGAFPFGPPGPTGGLGVGAGGGVVAGPFNVPPNQFGAIRFRVRIP